MTNYLLGFFDEASGTTGLPNYVTWIIIGVMLVAVVLLMIIPQRKQKKAAEEMMSKIRVGCTITTIGGIIGEIVELDESTNTFVICTGDEEHKQYIKFTKQAIYQVHKSETELNEQLAQEASKNNPEDEIK